MTSFEIGVEATGVDATMVAVEDIEHARATFSSAFAASSTEPEYVSSGRFYRSFVSIPGGGQVQLMQPGDGEEVLRGFLARRGQGLYGLVVGVADIERAYAWLQQHPEDYALVGGIVDLDDMREVIIHPKSMSGVLTVLRQRL